MVAAGGELTATRRRLVAWILLSLAVTAWGYAVGGISVHRSTLNAGSPLWEARPFLWTAPLLLGSAAIVGRGAPRIAALVGLALFVPITLAALIPVGLGTGDSYAVLSLSALVPAHGTIDIGYHYLENFPVFFLLSTATLEVTGAGIQDLLRYAPVFWTLAYGVAGWVMARGLERTLSHEAAPLGVALTGTLAVSAGMRIDSVPQTFGIVLLLIIAGLISRRDPRARWLVLLLSATVALAHQLTSLVLLLTLAFYSAVWILTRASRAHAHRTSGLLSPVGVLGFTSAVFLTWSFFHAEVFTRSAFNIVDVILSRFDLDLELAVGRSTDLVAGGAVVGAGDIYDRYLIARRTLAALFLVLVGWVGIDLLRSRQRFFRWVPLISGVASLSIVAFSSVGTMLTRLANFAIPIAAVLTATWFAKVSRRTGALTQRIAIALLVATVLLAVATPGQTLMSTSPRTSHQAAAEFGLDHSDRAIYGFRPFPVRYDSTSEAFRANHQLNELLRLEEVNVLVLLTPVVERLYTGTRLAAGPSAFETAIVADDGFARAYDNGPARLYPSEGAVSFAGPGAKL